MVFLTASATSDFYASGFTCAGLELSSMKVARYLAPPADSSSKGPDTAVCTSSNLVEF